MVSTDVAVGRFDRVFEAAFASSYWNGLCAGYNAGGRHHAMRLNRSTGLPTLASYRIRTKRDNEECTPPPAIESTHAWQLATRSCAEGDNQIFSQRLATRLRAAYGAAAAGRTI
jgi:hypothetical protein